MLHRGRWDGARGCRRGDTPSPTPVDARVTRPRQRHHQRRRCPRPRPPALPGGPSLTIGTRTKVNPTATYARTAGKARGESARPVDEPATLLDTALPIVALATSLVVEPPRVLAALAPVRIGVANPHTHRRPPAAQRLSLLLVLWRHNEAKSGATANRCRVVAGARCAGAGAAGGRTRRAAPRARRAACVVQLFAFDHDPGTRGRSRSNCKHHGRAAHQGGGAVDIGPARAAHTRVHAHVCHVLGSRHRRRRDGG
jgi:hypothetical protein